MRIPIVLAIALIVVAALPTQAQTLDRQVVPLTGRHLVAINAGFLSDAAPRGAVEVGQGISAEAEGFGGAAAVRYSYWVAEHLAIDLGVGFVDASGCAMAVDAKVESESAKITRVLLGLKYQPARMAMARNVRPYITGAVGQYTGRTCAMSTGPTFKADKYSVTAYATRVGIGIDVFVNSWFAVGCEAGYGFVGDFDRRIGSKTNYSSPELMVTMGAMLGGGAD